MDVIDQKTFLKFSIMDALYWAFYASFVGFISTYLLDCGMSNSVLSIMLACFMLASFIGAFFWGSVCDRAKTNKNVFIPEFIASIVISLLIFFFANKNIWVSTILYPVFGFLSSSLGSNLDSWMLRTFHKDAGTYGRARSIGSMGYAVTALFMGMLIKKFSFVMMPAGVLFFSLLVLIIAMSIKEMPFENVIAHDASSTSPLELFKPGPFLFMIVTVFFTGLAIAPINNLKIVILQSVGGDVGILGLDSFLGVMVQAFFIFISGSLKKIPVNLRLFLMAFTVLITMILVGTAINSWMIILGTIFANMSYGIMLPTQREIVETNVPASLKNTAHSLSDATFGSFSGILALMYSGFVMDTFGAKSVAFLGCAIMAIPVLLTLFKMFTAHKERN